MPKITKPLASQMQFMGELSVHLFDSREVHGRVLANRRVRTSARLDTHDALRRERLRAGENKLVFLRIDVVGDHVDVVIIPKPFAQPFNKRRLA